MPSCPTENRDSTKAACSMIQSTTALDSGIVMPRRASRASLSVLIWLLTSCTAFSAAPFASGLYAGGFSGFVVKFFLSSAMALCSAIIAGSPSVFRMMSPRPSSSMSLTRRLVTHSSVGPFVTTRWAIIIPVASSLPTTIRSMELASSTAAWLSARILGLDFNSW